MEYWNTDIIVHIEIEDDKVLLNHKTAKDNDTRVRHIRDNRVGTVCFTSTFVSAMILVTFEFETQYDAASTAVLKLMQNTHAPSYADFFESSKNMLCIGDVSPLKS